MMFREAESAKPIDAEVKEFRHRARTTSFNLDDFSEEEQVRYDLDTAGITGRDVPRNYKISRPLDAPGTVNNGFDIRDLPNR